jgi:hypothetical protein
VAYDGSGARRQTGTKIEDYFGVRFFCIADGLIVEIWETRDDPSLFSQLGLAPPAASPMS